MKLHDLDNPSPVKRISKVMESHYGVSIDFDRIKLSEAEQMLARVRSLLKEHRATTEFYNSHQNPSYTKLLMLEQALSRKISEQPVVPVAVDFDDPKTKDVLDKAARGQALSTDEQKMVTAIANMKKDDTRFPSVGESASVIREQSEIQQAQAVLAAKDMVDRVQGMIEDISEMQYKELPALADQIRNDLGTDQSSQFVTAASQALETLMQSIQTSKGSLEQAMNVLTGDAPTDLDMDLDQDLGAELDMDMDQDLEPELDMDLDTDMPDEEDDIAGPLGRERR